MIAPGAMPCGPFVSWSLGLDQRSDFSLLFQFPRSMDFRENALGDGQLRAERAA
jgi:hypothetical protein